MDAEPYRSNHEHLWAELARVEQLVRAQTVRWRATVASTKPDTTWGMAYVDDAEVARYLNGPFLPPAIIEPGLAVELRPHLEEERRMAEAIRARVDVTPPGRLRLTHLVEAFELSDDARDVLLLCLLPELDSRYRRLFGYLLDDASRGAATVGLLTELLQNRSGESVAARGLFESGASLIDHELVLPQVGQGNEGLSCRQVRVDDRIVGFLLGSDAVDPRLHRIFDTRPSGAGVAPLSEDEQALLDWIAAHRGVTIVLQGGTERDRLGVTVSIAAHLAVPTLVAHAGALRADDAPDLVRLVYREAILRAAAVCWRDCELLLPEGSPLPIWTELLTRAARHQQATLVDHAAPWDPPDRAVAAPLVRWPVRRPDVGTRKALWTDRLSAVGLRPELAVRLAQTFELTTAQIDDAVAVAGDLSRQQDPHSARVEPEQLVEACRRQAGRRLLTLTRRVEVPPGLNLDDDLILPDDNKQRLRELADRIRLRHLVAELHGDQTWRSPPGVVSMFVGSAGTGKTHAATCLASTLGLDLMKIDLPAVVSKWVGETEKNLQRVFAEAEDGNAIIFFDEADAFFGKRGEVKDAQDRWANMEVNYLLQRIEEYDGAVILATNLRQNIDEAFVRRIQVVIDFPFPDTDQRVLLWRRALAHALPRWPDAEVHSAFEVSWLARSFSLSGAAIQSVVGDAELRTLAEGRERPLALTHAHLNAALRRELEKSGHSLQALELARVEHHATPAGESPASNRWVDV